MCVFTRITVTKIFMTCGQQFKRKKKKKLIHFVLKLLRGHEINSYSDEKLFFQLGLRIKKKFIKSSYLISETKLSANRHSLCVTMSIIVQSTVFSGMKVIFHFRVDFLPKFRDCIYSIVFVIFNSICGLHKIITLTILIVLNNK